MEIGARPRSGIKRLFSKLNARNVGWTRAISGRASADKPNLSGLQVAVFDETSAQRPGIARRSPTRLMNGSCFNRLAHRIR